MYVSRTTRASGGAACASLLDNLVWVLFYLWSTSGSWAAPSWRGDTAGILALLVFFSLWFNYFAICEWRWGQTIGKNATGIEVRSLDGAERLTYGQASIRNLLRIVDFFLIGELMIAAGKRKQRLGDLAAKTVVVRRAPRAATTEPVAPPQSGSRSRAPSHNA